MKLKANGKRLWESLMDMAKIGPGKLGGNCRLALTDSDIEGPHNHPDSDIEEHHHNH